MKKDGGGKEKGCPEQSCMEQAAALPSPEDLPVSLTLIRYWPDSQADTHIPPLN